MPYLLFLSLWCLVANGAPTVAEAEQNFRETKGQLFRALLDMETSPEITRLKADLGQAQAERMKQLATGKISILSPKKNYQPASGAKLAELDMIWNAQDLKREQKEAIQKVFREARKSEESFRAELRKILSAKSRDHFLIQELGRRQLDAMLSSLEKTAALIRASSLDRDYAYRAFLREHRRQ